MTKRRLSLLFGMAVLGLSAAVASAGSVSYSYSNGSLSADVTFTAVAGGLQITVTNTQTGTFTIAQGVSSLAFNVSGLSTPTAFTELKGVMYSPTTAGATWTLADGTAFDDTSATNVIDHWGFSTSGSGVTLATAGTGAPGGSPAYLIFPGTGTVGPGGSLAGNHPPDIIGPANFFLTVSGVAADTDLASANFTDLVIGFGTGPDSYLVPLPAAAPLGLAMLGLLAWARRAHRKHLE